MKAKENKKNKTNLGGTKEKNQTRGEKTDRGRK